MHKKLSSAGQQWVKRLITVSKQTDKRLKALRHDEGISQWHFIRIAIDDALNRHDAQKSRV